jgi:6,7-dimethyl-8-ribityllumazine synthase
MHDKQPEFGKVKAQPEWKIAIVRSLWHGELTGALSADAEAALLAAGMKEDNIIFVDAPGSFEVPLLAQEAIENMQVSGVIALGVIIQGGTHHANLLAQTTATALMDVQLRTGVPVTFDILFVDTIEDARKRSTGAGGKGTLAALTLLTTLAKLSELRS